MLRTLLLLIVVLAGLFQLGLTLRSLTVPDVYRKDFIQEYLLARAVVAHADPYLPVSTLADQFLGVLPVPVFPHATPHPPPVALFTLPLALVRYETAATLWLAFELFCLCGSAWLLVACIQRRSSWGTLVLLTAATVAWAPVYVGLVVGQLMTLLLLLLSGCWLALRRNKQRLAGALLGLTLALKLMGIPLLLFFVVSKRWRTVVSAVVTAGCVNLVSIFLIGFDRVISYYLTVSGALFPLYRSAVHNISLWSIGWRLFDGTGSPVDLSIKAPPLAHAPVVAALVSAIVPIAFLSIGIAMALRCRNTDTSFGILVAASVLFHPVAWSHYLVLMAIPMVVAIQQLEKLKFPGRECFILLGVMLVLGIPSLQLHDFQVSFGELQKSGATAVPFIVGLFGLVYSIGILILISLLWYFDQSVTASVPVRVPSANRTLFGRTREA